MMKPMHVMVAILTALGTWNDVMTPLVIMSGNLVDTLSVSHSLTSRHSLEPTTIWRLPPYILALIPILIFYVICQKQILNGVANGAVKG